MNNLEKLELIDDIGRELQRRMTFAEIDSYFEAFGIPIGDSSYYNSKYTYVKKLLPKVKNEIILQIAEELDLENNFYFNNYLNQKESFSFWKAGHFKLFISHLATFKSKITVLKKSLEKYGISSFVAHEDIEPTREWQEEIEKALFTMDALLAVLMPGFKESNWTDQEIGVAIGREKLVIPIRKELDPYGFIGKFQGFQSKGKSVEEVSQAIFEILCRNDKTRMKIISVLCDLISLSRNNDEALTKLKILKGINDLPSENLLQLKQRIIENENLKNKQIVYEFNSIASGNQIEKISLKDFDKEFKYNDDNVAF